ncbi:hypothetical protein Tco_0271575 [Tanacetum coccineum]
MLAPGHYAQWSSQFMRYVHMKSNKDQLRRVYQQARCEDQVVLGVWQITSRDGESIMSYYSRFYKVMNEMVRNKLKVNTINKSKEIAKPVTPPSETASEEDMDTTPRSRNDRKTRQFGNQRIVIVVGAKETVCKKLKREKDYLYHKEKMLLCKQESKGVPLSDEQEDWLHYTDDEPDELELEAHYMYREKIQKVPTADS